MSIPSIGQPAQKKTSRGQIVALALLIGFAVVGVVETIVLITLIVAGVL